VRRISTGQSNDTRHRLGRDRRPAGLARLVGQQLVDALFRELMTSVVVDAM
jgi:hypothetical protein